MEYIISFNIGMVVDILSALKCLMLATPLQVVYYILKGRIRLGCGNINRRCQNHVSRGDLSEPTRSTFCLS
jgi:hypothetical protein